MSDPLSNLPLVTALAAADRLYASQGAGPGDSKGIEYSAFQTGLPAVIYQPGQLSPTAQVFNTLAGAVTAVKALMAVRGATTGTDGRGIIYVDGSLNGSINIAVPSGALDLDQIEIIGINGDTSTGQPFVLTTVEGSVATAQRLLLTNISLNHTGTATPFWSAPLFGALFLDGGTVSATSSAAPVMAVAAGFAFIVARSTGASVGANSVAVAFGSTVVILPATGATYSASAFSGPAGSSVLSSLGKGQSDPPLDISGSFSGTYSITGAADGLYCTPGRPTPTGKSGVSVFYDDAVLGPAFQSGTDIPIPLQTGSSAAFAMVDVFADTAQNVFDNWDDAYNAVAGAAGKKIIFLNTTAAGTATTYDLTGFTIVNSLRYSFLNLDLTSSNITLGGTLELVGTGIRLSASFTPDMTITAFSSIVLRGDSRFRWGGGGVGETAIDMAGFNLDVHAFDQSRILEAVASSGSLIKSTSGTPTLTLNVYDQTELADEIMTGALGTFAINVISDFATVPPIATLSSGFTGTRSFSQTTTKLYGGGPRTEFLINGSGATLNVGTAVIPAATLDEVTTSVVASDPLVTGVITSSGVSAAQVGIATGGRFQVNITGTVALNDFVSKATTADLCTVSSTPAAGDFAQTLETKGAGVGLVWCRYLRTNAF